jgi:mono/diheme cytochrome c family protein
LARSPGIEPAARVPFLALVPLAVGIAAGAAAAQAASPELAFSRHGQPTARLALAELLQLAPPREVRVHEPYEDGPASFAALPLARVLDAVYTPSWRDEEELLFSCRDGYQPTVPVARALAHRAWLAFERRDRPGFTIRKRESGEIRRIELAPFYLVWENLADERIRQEADYGWPYQLVGIDLIRRSDRFPRMTPPQGAPDEVLAGFAAFRVHCSKCHPLNGEGGSIGPELNHAASPALTRDPGWLRDWIEDPSRILPTARMPALNPALPDRARTVDEILAYLHAMATAGDAAESR